MVIDQHTENITSLQCGPNSAIMNKICPKLDMRNPSPDPVGFSFAAFEWKWQRAKVVRVDDHTRAALHDAASR